MKTARQTLEASMTEDQLLLAITDALTAHAWLWHHVRRSDKAIQQGHAGFPDICALKAGRVLFIETKATGGTLTEGQLAWRLAMPPASRAVTYVTAYPQDLDYVLSLVAS